MEVAAILEMRQIASTSFLLGWLTKLRKILVLGAQLLLLLRMSPELVPGFSPLAESGRSRISCRLVDWRDQKDITRWPAG